MKFDKYIKIGVLGIALWSLTGCTDWLDVQPVDQVAEEQMFTSEEGFRQGLNGVYVELCSSSLYGGDLLTGTVEVLAQRYKFANYGTMQNLNSLGQFDYTTDYSKSNFAGIWEKGYALIANVNTLLKNADEKKNLFTGDQYNWITGEAYALRAMLHFDLLRLFGPVYKTNKEGRAIPYNKEFVLSGTDLLSASKVLEYVIDDLKEAERRLANDPIIEQGPLLEEGSTEEENFWHYRTFRLNYYAVKALQARVYLYAEMFSEALAAAREVVAVQEQYFPFTTKSQVTDGQKPDRIFSSELVFALQYPNRNKIFTDYFTPDLKDDQMWLTPSTYLENIFGTLALNDWRYESNWKVASGHTNRCFYKYSDLETDAYYADLLPMIRMSEMYYIIAETAENETDALASINLVLDNRGVELLTSVSQLESTLLNEYQKEFWGEGQLFFYYKRMNASSILSAFSGGNVNMNDTKYVVPLPQSETDFR